MPVAWTARIPQLSLQPAEAVLHKGDRLLALVCWLGCSRRIAAVEQVQQRCRQLFRGAALRLAFEGMPVAVVDRKQAMQRLGCLTASIGPLLRS